MKRIIVAITPKKQGEKTNLLFPISFSRNQAAYLPSMNVDVDSELAIRFNGVVSSYYLFTADSFQDVKDFVQLEKRRMDNAPLEEKDNIYIAQLEELLASFKCENELSNELCKNLLPIVRAKIVELEGIGKTMLAEHKKSKERILSEGYFPSDSSCRDYLLGILKHLEDREINEMRFNFI